MAALSERLGRRRTKVVDSDLARKKFRLSRTFSTISAGVGWAVGNMVTWGTAAANWAGTAVAHLSGGHVPAEVVGYGGTAAVGLASVFALGHAGAVLERRKEERQQRLASQGDGQRPMAATATLVDGGHGGREPPRESVRAATGAPVQRRLAGRASTGKGSAMGMPASKGDVIQELELAKGEYDGPQRVVAEACAKIREMAQFQAAMGSGQAAMALEASASHGDDVPQLHETARDRIDAIIAALHQAMPD